MFWESDTESIQKSYAQGTLTAVKKVIFQNQVAWSSTSEGFVLFEEKEEGRQKTHMLKAD